MPVPAGLVVLLKLKPIARFDMQRKRNAAGIVSF
jgi:hypothetical protein